MRVLVLEAGTGVGGTWYWNRYPGARFDSESYSVGARFGGYRSYMKTDGSRYGRRDRGNHG